MPQARFRFYAELNDFLPPERRGATFEHVWTDQAAVKDMIESFGVPHTEVDLILANGESVDFSYRGRDGDAVSVYPVFESFDIAGLERLRPEPLRAPRFVLDVHLGRLAAWLRMLGFDTLYSNSRSDAELAGISRDERRILLTRDVGLLKRAAVTHSYSLRETTPRAQLHEVAHRCHLARLVRLFTRCLRCNALLRPAPYEEIERMLPPRVRELYDEFQACPECGRVFWKGSHYRRMLEVGRSVVSSGYDDLHMTTREQAWEILCEFTKSEGLRKHALAVEACVTAYARKLGEDEHMWSVTAVLHDFDWEIHPQLPDHPMKGEPLLAERGVEEEIRRAILSHAGFSGVPRDTPLTKVLYACDELAGCITAISYVKPHRSVFEVDVVSVRKKMKDKAFARSVNRQDIVDGAQELGVDLDQHIAFCIQAMQERAEDLGVKGSV